MVTTGEKTFRWIGRHMLRIRLRRVGAKRQPSYRIVVAESTTSRDSKSLEVIGFYNPRTEPETVRLDEGRALYWLSVGASPSDAVARILKTQGTMERLERLRAGATLESLVAEVGVAAPAPERAKPAAGEAEGLG
jgi:small subunit ribosomal protein S16